MIRMAFHFVGLPVIVSLVVAYLFYPDDSVMFSRTAYRLSLVLTFYRMLVVPFAQSMAGWIRDER